MDRYACWNGSIHQWFLPAELFKNTHKPNRKLGELVYTLEGRASFLVP